MKNCEVCKKEVERLTRIKMPPNHGGIKYVCDCCIDKLDDYYDRKISERKSEKK